MNHWLPITKLGAFNRQGRGKFFQCAKCLKGYSNDEQYKKHKAKCTGLAKVQTESIPTPAVRKFEDYAKTIDMPTVMYADIEAILEKMDPVDGSNTQRTNRHIPCAIGNMII